MILVCYCSEYSDLKAFLFLLFLSSTHLVHSTGYLQVPAFLSDLVSFVSPIKTEMISIDGVESNALLHARQTSADACDTQCSWVVQAESCNDNVACACQVIEGAGVSGVASCGNCLEPINATLASEAVQIGEYCGVTAVPSLTFPFVATSTPTVTTTPFVTTPTTATITSSTSVFSVPPVVVPHTQSSSTVTSSSASTSNTPGSVSSAPSTETSSGSSGLSGGAIGGIVGGIVGTFIISGALLFWWVRRYGAAMRRPVPRPITPEVAQWQQPPAPKFVEHAAAPLPTIAEDVPSGRLRYPDEALEQPALQEPEGARLSRAY